MWICDYLCMYNINLILHPLSWFSAGAPDKMNNLSINGDQRVDYVIIDR